jgi:hypothetical protein
MDERKWLAEQFEERRPRLRALEGKPFSVMAFTVRGGKITEISST